MFAISGLPIQKKYPKYAKKPIIEESEKRPDIIVFINGMPLIVVELKSTTREEVKLEETH